MQDLIDDHLFAEAKGVLDGLHRRDCTAALQWCEEHQTRLRKQKSKLEFGLRVQVPPAHLSPRHHQPACLPTASPCTPAPELTLPVLPSQEFLELVRQQQQGAALRYARQHFAPFAEAHFSEMRRAVTALAVGADTTCGRYAELFDPSRWDLLAELFQQDLFRMHSLTQRSLLDLHLQVVWLWPPATPARA